MNERSYIYQQEIQRAVKSAAHNVYNRFQNPCVDSDDLVQEGLLKAYQLMDNYQPDRGSIMTYLWRRISKVLERYVIRNIRESGMFSIDAVEVYGREVNNYYKVANHVDLYDVLYDQNDQPLRPPKEPSIDMFHDKQYRGHRDLVDNPQIDIAVDVRDILSELPPEDRELAIDRFIHDETLDTLSHRYETSKSSIRRRLLDLKERIKHRYEHGQLCQDAVNV